MGYIASGVGRQLYVLLLRIIKDWVLLRILVEVDINADFPKRIEVDMGNGRSCSVGVEYPWIPSKYDQCKMFGHSTTSCPKKITKTWIPIEEMKLNEKQKVPEKQSVGENVLAEPCDSHSEA